MERARELSMRIRLGCNGRARARKSQVRQTDRLILTRPMSIWKGDDGSEDIYVSGEEDQSHLPTDESGSRRVVG